MNHKVFFILVLGLSLVACDMEKVYEQFVGNTFTDVDGNNLSLSNSNLGWGTFNPYKGANIFNTCGTEKLVGGRGIFGARSAIFKSFKLPPHHTI